MKKKLAFLLALVLLTLPILSLADSVIAFQRLDRSGIEGQKWSVYSAPSHSAWRNGSASVSTNGEIYYAGWDGDWLLIAYQPGSGGWRVGYVNVSEPGVASVPRSCNLSALFSSSSASVPAGTRFSDDITFSCCQVTVGSSASVTLLGTLSLNGYTYPYIQTTMDGSSYRGLVTSIN